MSHLTALATWIQRYLIYLVVPGIIIMRIIAWSKLDCNMLYLIYQEMEGSQIAQDASQLPLFGKLLYFTLETVPAIIIVIALWYFWNILSLYKEGKTFTSQICASFKKINFCVFFFACYRLLFATLASLCISLFKPVGQRYVMVKVDFNDIMHFGVVLLLCMTLYILQEAQKIKSEQDLVV